MRASYLIILFFLPFLSYAKTYKIETRNKMGNESMIFVPSVLKINPGDKVVFVPTNKGHFSQSVFTPKMSSPWKGETSKQLTLTLNEEGVYIYKCGNHGLMGMVGIIQVGKAQNIKDAKEFIKTLKKSLVMNKQRLDKYIQKIIQ